MEWFWNNRKLKLNMPQYAISRLTIFHSVLYAFWGKDHLLTCKQSCFMTWFEEKTFVSIIENDDDDDTAKTGSEKIQCPNADNCNERIRLHFSNNAGIVVASELVTGSLAMLDPLWWIHWAMTDSDGKGTSKLITFPN